MSRLRYNGLQTTLGASLTNSATSVTLGAALTYNGGTAVPTIAAANYIPLSILDADGRLSEIVHLTAYTAAATTGTIVRGREGTAGVAHASGAMVVHAPSVEDIAGRSWETAISALAPVHRWLFNEASGTNVDDSVGSLDLTLSGTYTRAATGPFGSGGATTFANATADSSGLGSVPVLTADRTVVFLFRSAELSRMILFGYGTASALALFYASLNDSGSGGQNNTACCHTGGNYSDASMAYVDSVALSDDRWHLGVVTMSLNGKRRAIAIDGRVGDGVFPQSSTPNSGNFRVGKAVDGNLPFYGNIADVSVYNYAMTSDQITDLYRSFAASLA